ncbi:MAG: alpha/beta fold hydrolase [Acidimicrobiia bacterium]
MLFAHANGFHGLVWAPVARRLKLANRKFSFDFAGHGRSPAPDGHNFGWDGFGDDVLAVVDALELDRPIGIGHSLGGASSVLAELKRPGTFRALYLYEPIISPFAQKVGAEGNQLAQAASRRREVFASREEAYANYAGKAPLSSMTAEALRAYVEHGFEDLVDGTVRLRCRRDTEAAVFANSMNHGAYDRLGELTVPVTVATGADDGHGPAGWAPPVAQAIPQGVLEPHPDLGHLGPMEDPDAVAAAIEQFIRNRVTPGA